MLGSEFVAVLVWAYTVNAKFPSRALSKLPSNSFVFMKLFLSRTFLLLTSAFWICVSAYDSRAVLTAGAPGVCCFPSCRQWTLQSPFYKVPYEAQHSWCSAPAQHMFSRTNADLLHACSRLSYLYPNCEWRPSESEHPCPPSLLCSRPNSPSTVPCVFSHEHSPSDSPFMAFPEAGTRFTSGDAAAPWQLSTATTTGGLYWQYVLGVLCQVCFWVLSTWGCYVLHDQQDQLWMALTSYFSNAEGGGGV